MGILKRQWLIASTVLVAISICALMFAPGDAAAATTCRAYDGLTLEDSNTARAGSLCVAPSADYPSFKGWARMSTAGLATAPSACGFSLFPYDIDEPRPMMGCMTIKPPVAPTWQWTASGWKADSVADEMFSAGERAYVYPYSGSWRWVWNEKAGWRAVDAKYVAIRWFAPTGGTARLV